MNKWLEFEPLYGYSCDWIDRTTNNSPLTWGWLGEICIKLHTNEDWISLKTPNTQAQVLRPILICLVLYFCLLNKTTSEIPNMHLLRFHFVGINHVAAHIPVRLRPTDFENYKKNFCGEDIKELLYNSNIFFPQPDMILIFHQDMTCHHLTVLKG